MLLSDNNPNFVEFGKALEEVLTKESYNSLGGVKHTKGKKGIKGMEGDQSWKSSSENAQDFIKPIKEQLHKSLTQ